MRVAGRRAGRESSDAGGGHGFTPGNTGREGARGVVQETTGAPAARLGVIVGVKSPAMKATSHRPVVLVTSLCVATALLAQEPPPAPENPAPGVGQARPLVPPPTGPVGEAPPLIDEEGRTVPPGAPAPGTTLAEPRLPRLGVGTLNIDALAVGGVDIALDPVNVIANFQQTPRSDQDVALADLRTRVDATSRALVELRARARAQGVPVEATLNSRLTAEMEQQEEALKRTLSTVPVANTDEEWRRVQSDISTQYSAYANAVRRVQMSLQTNAPEAPPETPQIPSQP